MESRSLRLIPEIALSDVLGTRRPSIQITVQAYEDGTLVLQDMLALLSIAVAESPQELLEIGTYSGRTTRALAENLPASVVHTVDLPPDFSVENDPVTGLARDDLHLIRQRIVGREFHGRQCERRIVQHLADTAEWDYREAGRPRLFFIDGDHTYDYCKNDSEKCFALSEGTGVFLWHDCDELHPGVLRMLTEWRQKGRNVVRIAGTALAYYSSSDVAR
jgi:hypothetical protein